MSILELVINLLILSGFVTLMQILFNRVGRLIIGERNQLAGPFRNARNARNNPRPRARRQPSAPRQRRGIRNRSLSPQQFNLIARPSAEEIRGGICAVCLSELNENQSLRKLVCNHIFHEDCLFGWVGRQEATCPICRRNVMNSY